MSKKRSNESRIAWLERHAAMQNKEIGQVLENQKTMVDSVKKIEEILVGDPLKPNTMDKSIYARVGRFEGFKKQFWIAVTVILVPIFLILITNLISKGIL